MAQIPKGKLESKNHDLENEGSSNENEPQGEIIELRKVRFRQLQSWKIMKNEEQMCFAIIMKSFCEQEKLENERKFFTIKSFVFTNFVEFEISKHFKLQSYQN